MEGDVEPIVLEIPMTAERWAKFERVVALCERLTGRSMSFGEWLELVCRTYLERRGLQLSEGRATKGDTEPGGAGRGGVIQ